MPNSPKLLNILCYVAPRHLFFQDINLNVVVVLYLFILFIFIDINVKLAPTKLHLLVTQQWNTTLTLSLFKNLFRIQPTSPNPNPAFVLSLTRLSVTLVEWDTSLFAYKHTKKRPLPHTGTHHYRNSENPATAIISRPLRSNSPTLFHLGVRGRAHIT